MEEVGRLLHRNWEDYDTAHVVFRPKRMTVEELQEGYERIYRRLFSPASIWARRPRQADAVLPDVAMSHLYKKSNWYWHLLIRHRPTALAWRGLVEWTRSRHVRFQAGTGAEAGGNG